MNGIVFLIGYMGVGKTTVGKKLAKYFEVDFVDTDRIIERKFSCSVSEYFEKFGEDSFRIEEQKVLKNIINDSEGVIVSVGGGLPCFLGNMELMNTSGITVYLKRPSKELFQRLKQGKSKRPLIAEMSDEQLLVFIEHSLKSREKYYSQALLTADRNSQEPEELAKLINSV